MVYVLRRVYGIQQVARAAAARAAAASAVAGAVARSVAARAEARVAGVRAAARVAAVVGKGSGTPPPSLGKTHPRRTHSSDERGIAHTHRRHSASRVNDHQTQVHAQESLDQRRIDQGVIHREGVMGHRGGSREMHLVEENLHTPWGCDQDHKWSR